ncbi:MAG: RimK family alpha-L-glutamate ligase [Planctomycetota bacterium]
MRIGILSRGPKLYSTRRLREAALARGHEVKVLDTLAFAIEVRAKGPKLYFRDKPLRKYDAVIPRIGPSISAHGTAVVRQFEQMGVFSLNSANAIAVARDKLRSLQVLSRHDVGLPASALVRSKGDVMPAIERVGGAPVIIKLLQGSQGVGVILAESTKIAEAILQTLQSTQPSVLVQKFVAESKGKDIRALVVGGKVVAAMRRKATGDEFRSNTHRGGSIEAVELDEDYERTAVHAAAIMGLRVAGVDMLEASDGPQVLEVNASPGLEGIEAASGADIAGAIIEELEEQVRFPDVDLHQKLSLRAGYNVAEFTVDRKSELAGKTLDELALRERDIVVLNIQRGGVAIPNPSGKDKLLAGDTLLCFGKSLVLRDLVPAKNKRKKKTKKA